MSARPRRFEIFRGEDPSGVSGTGIVAYGVEFEDGTVVFQWRNEANDDLHDVKNGLSVKPGPNGVEDTEEVHGHGNRTHIRWIDEEE